MRFENRTQAGQLLCSLVKKYKNKDVVVYALPRGGVLVGVEVAKYLEVPLDLVITRKIGHPSDPEYAIAAVSENGEMAGNSSELMSVDESYVEHEVEKQRKEAIRRRREYLGEEQSLSPAGKIAILVDDGAATGLTLRAAILDLKRNSPDKIVILVPVIPRDVVKILEKEADEVLTLSSLHDDLFRGAVGAYYEDFKQVEDYEVVRILQNYKEHMLEKFSKRVFSIKHTLHEHDFMDFDRP